MHLIQSLSPGPLDIVGDIHGEYDALCNLMQHLGYTPDGRHPAGRKLVFVGDFCDRGPDSPAVLHLVAQLVQSGRAAAVVGNHELNLLRNDPKDGAGWFFDARMQHDQPKYAPYARPGSEARASIVTFLSTLPVGLERSDLRIVHAAWINEHVEAVRPLTVGKLLCHYDDWEQAAEARATASGLQKRMAAEKADLRHDLENQEEEPPFQHALAEYGMAKQMMNPLKVLTSGVERIGSNPFYTSGKWRFVERVAWWDDYEDTIPVVIGHYWRQVNQIDRAAIGKGDENMFADTHPYAWHGKRNNVFCIDFSVGGRWQERKAATPLGRDFKLAALSWPERELVFDDGLTTQSTSY